MPIDYKKYPANWKTEIRPAVLERAKHRCECCGVDNYDHVFRAFINRNQPTQKEVYQDVDGRVYDANNSKLLFKDFYADIYPLSGKLNQKAVKIILTIAHLDHDIKNNDLSNLKAMCQRCHLRYDKERHSANAKATRNKKKGLIELNFK